MVQEGKAYTLGRSLSRFWHQMATAAYSSHAQALTQGLLGFREGSQASKTVRALAIFLVSGATHAACNWRLGDRCGWSGNIWFFATCFAAVGVERTVRKAKKGWRVKKGGKREGQDILQSTPQVQIFLQPFATPAALGLTGFACWTFITNDYIANWWGTLESPTIFFPFVGRPGSVHSRLLWLSGARYLGHNH
jgi:hypothetical protein